MSRRGALYSLIGASAKNRLSQLFHQFRNDLEQVPDDPIVRHLEYRRFLVLVDGDDDADVLHAREVLDRARDAHGDVELRRDDLAGLPDLPVVRHEPRVHGRARSPHRRAQLSARGSRILKLSPEPIPRPPDTTTRAEVSSGRSDLVSARPTSDD